MARYALVKDGMVQNFIDLEEGAEWEPPRGCTLVEHVKAMVDGPRIGGKWDGKAFHPKPVVELSSREALLKRLGISEEDAKLLLFSEPG